MQQQRRENMDVQAADEKILDILRKDSQKGLILLMEKYTGLVWHVVSFYIENPFHVTGRSVSGARNR